MGTKPGFTISGSDCFPDNTVDSSDPSKYRHFAVDDAHGLLYYCDQNPKLDRTLCYYSNVTNGTNHWKGEQWNGSIDLSSLKIIQSNVKSCRATSRASPGTARARSACTSTASAAAAS